MATCIPFLIKKRDIYYLQKRVPKKLIPNIGREFVRLSLRTKDKATAIRTAGPILAALERDWHYQIFAIPTGTSVLDHFGPNASNEPTLAEAAESYVEMKARAEDRKFTNPTNLVINAIVQLSTSTPIHLAIVKLQSSICGKNIQIFLVLRYALRRDWQMLA